MSKTLNTLMVLAGVLVCGSPMAMATDVTGASNMSAIQGSVDGDNLINFDQTGTLTMNAGATAVNTITVQNGVTATINWNSSSNAIVFADAAGVITLLGNSTITFTNGGANNGFDFATTAGTASARTLTITSSSAGSLGADLAGNILILGRGNTVVFAASGGAADALDTVTINDNTTAAPTIDVDATLTIDTLTITNAGDDVDFNIANGITCTVTDAATLAGDSILELIVDATANDDILAFTGGLTLNGTSTLRFTNDTGRVNGTVTAGADGVTIDVDGTATIATLTPTQDATIDIADSEQLTIVNAVTIPDASTLTFAGTNNAAAETLVFTGGLTLGGGTSGTFNTTTDTSNALVVTGTIAPAAGSTLDIDASTNATVTLGANATIDVAASQTLTGTTTVATNTLTLAGTGTLSRVDVTTGTITDNGGVTLSDLRALPGGGNTTTIGGTGNTTVTTLANALTGAANVLNKVGTGTLTIVSGLTTALDNATGVLIDIDAGTIVVGSAGTNDDITFDDDTDEITVASGSTLTTFGSFTVGAAGANVNLDAATGSIVNLNSTGGAETITAAANDDFNLLGTVNIGGSDGDYTISDAFDYKFGDVNINDGNSLINNQPSGEMKFVAGSTVTLNGNATFTVNGQATGTRITMDTTSGADSFTIARRTSTGLTIKNVDLSRVTYTSTTSDTAQCDGIDFTGVNFNTSNTKWEGACSDTSTPPPPPSEERDSGTVDADGETSVTTETSSGTSAEVRITDGTEDGTVDITLTDSNTQDTFDGMAGGDADEGNGIPRTLTIDSTLEEGSFIAVVEICYTALDLSRAALTDEEIVLYVFNETTMAWDVAGTNNVGSSAPTDVVGDYGIDTDRGCAWTVVDGFSTFAPGQVDTFSIATDVDPTGSGTIAVSPEQTVYSDGMTVSVTATPGDGRVFSDWTGDVTGSDNPLSVTLTADTSVTARFVDQAADQFTLTVAVDPQDGGSVAVSPDQAVYDDGTEIMLTADAAAGFDFSGWSGDAEGSDNPLSVTIGSDLAITAGFMEQPTADDGNGNDNANDNGGGNANDNGSATGNENDNGSDEMIQPCGGPACGPGGAFTIGLVLFGLVGMKLRRRRRD